MTLTQMLRKKKTKKSILSSQVPMRPIMVPLNGINVIDVPNKKGHINELIFSYFRMSYTTKNDILIKIENSGNFSFMCLGDYMSLFDHLMVKKKRNITKFIKTSIFFCLYKKKSTTRKLPKENILQGTTTKEKIERMKLHKRYIHSSMDHPSYLVSPLP